MKKVVGTLVFLAAFLLATSGHSPEYEFRNVWKIKNFSVVDYEDLDGDGLSEILCIKYQNTKEFISNQTVIALLDIHSTILWQIKVDGFLSSSQFEDIDGDGIKEIFLDIQVISSNNICPQFQKYKLICVNAQGTVLWKKMLEKWFLTFNDIDKDGCKEIMVGSVILDKDGNIYAEYDDYSITGCIEDPFRIILDKKINNGTKKEYISYKIVTIQGETLWEKKFLAPAVLEVVEVENKKRVFILTKSEITELNLNTYEETFCSTYNQELYRAHMNSVDIDGDNNIEYVIETLDHGIFGSSSVYVYDDTFKLLWKYTDPAFYAKIEDLDNDKKHEILIYYRNMYMDGIVDNGFFTVLNYDTSKRWTIFLESVSLSPYLIDIDVDGDIELLFNIGVSDEVYLYVLDPDGEIENQIKVPGRILFYKDVDGDTDTDFFCYAKENYEELHLYTNTRFQGELDIFSGLEALEEVNIGEKNIKRNFWSPAFFYRYEAVIYYLGYPERVRQRYSWKVSLLFSMLAGLGVGVALFLVKKFEKSDAWDVLWNFKKVLYYMGFLVVAPASIVYFVYAAAKLNKEYRKALGFVAPVRKNILYSAVIGVIFFLVWKAAEFVMAVNGIPYVGFDFPKVGLDYVDTLIWSWGVLLIFCLPFVEEILLSGYFYPIIKEKKGINYGIGVTALLFTFFHLVFALFKLQIALIPFFYIFSGIKMYSYERTHCIYVPLIIYNLYYIAAALLFITI